MRRRIKTRSSKLATLQIAIKGVLPRGLPKEVAKFYKSVDGLTVTIDDDKAELVGVAAMFGGLKKGAFPKHVVAKLGDLEDFVWSGLPFYEQFFTEHGDVTDKKSLAQLNLRMRLKLLASVEGESTELAIDYYDTAPTIYLVDHADAAYPLKGLGFGDFVEWFSKFGTNRWYYAFLDKKAQEVLNLDLRAELERSLAEFPADEWAPLLARFPKARAPRAERVVAAAPSKRTATTALPPLTDAPAIIAGGSPRSVAFGAGGQLVVGDGDYELLVYDVATRKQVWRQKNAHAIAVSSDGETIAVLEHKQASSWPDRLVLRAPATGKALHRAPWVGGELATLAWTGGGKVVVSDTQDTLHLVDAASLREVSSIAKQPNVRRLGAIGEATGVLVHVQAFDDGARRPLGPSAVTLFDLGAAKPVETWDGAVTFAVTPDGARFAFGFIDKTQTTVRIVQRTSGNVVRELAGGALSPDQPPHYGFHLALSPDGERVAVSEQVFDATAKTVTSTVSVYDVTTGSVLGRTDLGRHPDYPRSTVDAESLAISADGVLCVATGSDGLRLWSLP